MFWRKPKELKWDYMVVDEQFVDLADLGKRGWELVSVIYRTTGEERQRPVLYLKTPLKK